MPERLLVHCRAGMGRTGATVNLINSLVQIKKYAGPELKNAPLSVFDIANKARMQRHYFCNQANQYAFIYECLLNKFK